MKKITATFGCLAALLLSACGSDQPASTLPDTVEGLWSGPFTINGDSTSYEFHALVAPDSSLWMIYTDGSGNLVGAIQGDGSSDSSTHTWSASGLNERTATGTHSGAAIGPFVAQSKFSFTLVTDADTTPRTLNANPGYSPIYRSDYLQGSFGLATNANFAGTALAKGGAYPMTIVKTGNALEGQVNGSGCTYTGSISDPTPANFFLVEFSFPAVTGCDDLGLGGSLAGLMFLDNGHTKLIIVSSDSTLAFLGS